MRYAHESHGGAPVGLITALDRTSAASVLYLRLRSDGPQAQTDVKRDFTLALGEARGERALQCLSDLCSLCAAHGRRPLMRHSVTCKCLGSDESCFANFIVTAAEGEREDAMLIATLLVRPDIAPMIIDLACDRGLALKRMCLSTPKQMSESLRSADALH